MVSEISTIQCLYGIKSLKNKNKRFKISQKNEYIEEIQINMYILVMKFKCGIIIIVATF